MSGCNEILATEQNLTETMPVNGGYVREQTNTYSASLYTDFFNKRLKVLNYTADDYAAFSQYLEDTANHYGLSKIILIAQKQDWESLFRHGYILEALHPTFFRGEPGYHLSKFFSSHRRTSLLWDDEETVLKQVFQLSAHFKALPPDYQIRSARSADIPELAALYASIFETYPTPIDDPQYIQKAMNTDTHFKIMLHEGKIVSAASLDIDTATKSAELTDCATLPQYRGLSLMSHLAADLEKEARNRGLVTVYTIARAGSVGINAVFFRHGYAYYGRFVNNCEICGKFEDMNLWSKHLAAAENQQPL